MRHEGVRRPGRAGAFPRIRPLIGSAAAAALLATCLLFVTQPAAGQEGLPRPTFVRITSAPTAGTYVVGWRTLGGCDPGSGTSGFAGEVRLRVEPEGVPDDTPTPGELTGTPGAAVVVVRSICKYVWSVSFVEATTGANCIVGPAPFEPDENSFITITLDDPESACAQRERIVVQLVPALPLAEDDVDHNAILRARFSATAQPVKRAPSECGTGTATSEVDDKDTTGDETDDTVSIELEVVATTADGRGCRYDVTLSVPGQLDTPDHDREQPVFEDVAPGDTISVRLSAATKKIYLLQSVVGDSGGAAARYVLEKTCADPDPLPEPLEPRPARGGIQTIDPVSFVELREGRFNITAALADDPSAPDAFDGVAVRVLDGKGVGCRGTVTVSELPEHCRAAATTLEVDLVNAPDPTVLEFRITCHDDVGQE